MLGKISALLDSEVGLNPELLQKLKFLVADLKLSDCCSEVSLSEYPVLLLPTAFSDIVTHLSLEMSQNQSSIPSLCLKYLGTLT